jgi:peptide/nickel transport system substrate-binding protein
MGSADVYLKSALSGPVCFIPSSRDEDSPLAKLEVRQAIAHAINRQAICDARGFGIWTPGTQIIAEGFMGHLPSSYDITYDPAKSKQLLAQAGYPGGFSTTIYSPASIDRDAMVAVQSMLKDVGINAELEFPESGAASELRSNWKGIYVNVVSSFPNMTSMFGLYFDPDYLYYPRMWRPEDMAGLYKESRTTKQLEPKLVEQFHQGLMENMLVVPLYNIYSSYLIRNNFHDTGFTEWASGTQWLSHLAWMSSK